MRDIAYGAAKVGRYATKMARLPTFVARLPTDPELRRAEESGIGKIGGKQEKARQLTNSRPRTQL